MLFVRASASLVPDGGASPVIIVPPESPRSDSDASSNIRGSTPGSNEHAASEHMGTQASSVDLMTSIVTHATRARQPKCARFRGLRSVRPCLEARRRSSQTAGEALACRAVLAELGVQHLDRDGAIDSQMSAEIHPSHAAAHR